MWSKTTRGQYDRKGQRYPSDLTDEEWALVEPYLRPMRRVDRRDVLNAILYVLTTGCQWRQLPKDFPPKSTVHGYFIEWHCDGTLTRLHHALYCAVRELEGRVATPTTSIVDSQSVKGAEKRGAPIDASGYDAGKKIKGKKRHIAVDTLGLMRPERGRHPARGRQAFGCGKGFRGAAQALDRREDIRMARPLPPPHKGLREPRTLTRSLRHPGHDT